PSIEIRSFWSLSGSLRSPLAVLPAFTRCQVRHSSALSETMCDLFRLFSKRPEADLLLSTQVTERTSSFLRSAFAVGKANTSADKKIPLTTERVPSVVCDIAVLLQVAR